MEDLDGTLASVAQCIEQLRQSSSSSQEKDNSLRQLLDLINTRENSFGAVGSHSQAVPVLISLLQSGSMGIKIQAATVLGSLCKENELRVKVLLGGCIPPLLGLLKSNSAEGQIAAAKTIFAVSQGNVKDHISSTIFSTEGVVHVLWGQLEKGLKAGNVVDDLLTGALRNLSSSTEGFRSATYKAGGVDTLIKLLMTGQSSTQANVCFLLACMMMEDASICSKVLTSEATKLLVTLLGPGNEAPVRAQAAAALKYLYAHSKEAGWDIANATGIPVLINTTIAPSKEFMQGEFAQALQENSECTLPNISGGLSYVISSLGQSLESCASPAQAAATTGALASDLMICDRKAEISGPLDSMDVEKTQVQQFKPRSAFLVQERTTEALASLHGNLVLASKLKNSEALDTLAFLSSPVVDIGHSKPAWTVLADEYQVANERFDSMIHDKNFGRGITSFSLMDPPSMHDSPSMLVRTHGSRVIACFLDNDILISSETRTTRNERRKKRDVCIVSNIAPKSIDFKNGIVTAYIGCVDLWDFACSRINTLCSSASPSSSADKAKVSLKDKRKVVQNDKEKKAVVPKY